MKISDLNKTEKPTGGGFQRVVTWSKGIHSIKAHYTFSNKLEKIIVESNFGKSSMVAKYLPDEKQKAIACFERLITSDITCH